MADVVRGMGDVHTLHAPLRSSASHTSFFDSSLPYRSPRKNSYSFSDLRSPSLSSSQASSVQSTAVSSLSPETKLDDSTSTSDDNDEDDDDEGLVFPAYDVGEKYKKVEDADAPPSSPVQSTMVTVEVPSPAPDQLPISEDDTAVRMGPSQHVDYLSHDWKEEDIWSSWRHIVEHRRVYGERSRLENASWRTWAKTQFKLKTTSPESLNWLKDVDITWLYGPLQPASNRSISQQTSEPTSRLSKTNSFLHKKPILKKRSMSEVMLQKSISASSLVKQAAAVVQAQQASGISLERRRPRPIIGHANTDFTSIPSRTISRDPADYSSSRSTSGLQTPDQPEKKHIRFDEKVEQCIAVEVKGADDDDEEDFNHNPWAKYRDDDSSSDEGVVMMKRTRRKRPLSRTSSKTSIAGESKTIAKLPSTTLKYRTDSPDTPDQQLTHSLGLWRSSRLSPSPSQETLRPSNPSTNFLLPEDQDDDDDEGFTFGPSGAHQVKRPSTPTPSDPYSKRPSTPPAGSSESGGLRRTASGMFMPFEDEDENPPSPGIIGRVVDTVNTARDIAHVIWNVGWKN